MKIYVIEYFREYQGDRCLAVVAATSPDEAYDIAKVAEVHACSIYAINELDMPTSPVVLSKVSSFGF